MQADLSSAGLSPKGTAAMLSVGSKSMSWKATANLTCMISEQHGSGRHALDSCKQHVPATAIRLKLKLTAEI